MTIYLDSVYRTWLFCRAYINSGESLGSLAKELGYKGKGRNGMARDMWLGTIGVPNKKMTLLCKLAKVNESDLTPYYRKKEEIKKLDDWLPLIQKYKTFSKPIPEIFLG